MVFLDLPANGNAVPLAFGTDNADLRLERVYQDFEGGLSFAHVTRRARAVAEYRAELHPVHRIGVSIEGEVLLVGGGNGGLGPGLALILGDEEDHLPNVGAMLQQLDGHAEITLVGGPVV